MCPSDWTVLPIEPCDPVALDAIAELPDEQLDALITRGPADTTRRSDTKALRRPGGPGWRHHVTTPGLPAFHLALGH